MLTCEMRAYILSESTRSWVILSRTLVTLFQEGTVSIPVVEQYPPEGSMTVRLFTAASGNGTFAH